MFQDYQNLVWHATSTSTTTRTREHSANVAIPAITTLLVHLSDRCPRRLCSAFNPCHQPSATRVRSTIMIRELGVSHAEGWLRSAHCGIDAPRHPCTGSFTGTAAVTRLNSALVAGLC
jgi:hypothetical protein